MISNFKSTLIDIWGSSSKDVFIVGDQGNILHNDVGSWSQKVITSNDLNGIWGDSSTGFFVVGDYGTILHYGALN
jgi:hypothetical protein